MRVKWVNFAIIGLFSCTSLLLSGGQVTSETFVGTTITIKGAGTNASRDNWISLGVVKPFVSAGVLTSVSGNTVADEEAGWQSNQFDNGTFYIEFLDTNAPSCGLMADILATDGHNQTLTLSANVSQLVSVGTPYRIRQHFTFFEIFGEHNEAGLRSHANPGIADLIELQFEGTNCRVYYVSVATPPGWYQVGNLSSPIQNVKIFPEQGIRITRRGTDDIVIPVHGQLKRTPTKVPVYAGGNILGTLKSFKAVRLDELNLYTGNPVTGIRPAATLSSAFTSGDTLDLFDSDGNFLNRYFWCASTQSWSDFSWGNANSVTVPPKAAVVINAKGISDGFTWEIPGE